MNSRLAKIEHRLIHELSPVDLSIEDLSHLHAGHPGAKDGRGHYAVTITAQRFRGIGSVKRHQMVYAALGDLMQSDIHAIKITASAPTEQ